MSYIVIYDKDSDELFIINDNSQTVKTKNYNYGISVGLDINGDISEVTFSDASKTSGIAKQLLQSL